MKLFKKNFESSDGSITTMGVDSRKIIFFLFVYYLCLDPILYMLSHYFTNGNIILKNSVLNIFYLEQIVFVLTILLILSSSINVGKYLNFHSGCALLLFIWIFFIVLFSFFDVGLVSFWGYYGFSNLIIARGFIFILLGLNIHIIHDMFREEKTRLLFYTISAIYFAIIILSAIYNPLAEKYPWYLSGITKITVYKNDNLDAIFDYLYISNTVALLLLFIMSRMKSLHIKLLITVFGSFIIILCGSRASLICFAAAGMINFTIHFLKANTKKKVSSAFLIILLITLSITIGPLLIDQSISAYRVYGENYRFNPHTLLDSDGSYLLRQQLFEDGLRELKDTWLLGRYMSEAVEGRSGNYMHNWLSFLSAFGIGPFLLCVFLMVSALYRNARQFLKDSNSPINELLFLWSIFMIAVIVFARSYDYYYIWFILLGIPMNNHRFAYSLNHGPDQ